jgi:signal transduction histidine kinase
LSGAAALRPSPGAFAVVRQRFDALPLALQIAVAAAAVAAPAGALAASAGSDARVVIALVCAVLAAAAAGAALASRTARALGEVAKAAQALTPDDAPAELSIPLQQASPELQRATAQLQRMVEAARRRQRELEAQNLALSRQLGVRTHQLTTLQDLSIGLATRNDLQELVGEALKALQQTIDYSSASVWGRRSGEGDGPVVLLGYRTEDADAAPARTDLTGMRLSRANLQRYEQIERERQPVIENRVRHSLLSWLWQKVTDDARSSALYQASRSWMAAPLAVRDRVLGVLRVDHHESDYFDAERSRLLLAVSSQAALAMRHAQLAERELELAVVAERNRIARELHDAVSQTLFAANVVAGTLARSAARGETFSAEAVSAQAQALERLNRAALAEMRLLMYELRPDALRRTPLHELLHYAIDAMSCRGDIQIESEIARDDDLEPDVRIHLYRIAQEATSNIARHSRARHALIRWQVHGSRRATLVIADDGQGFDPEQSVPGHFGLENMRSRAHEIGARFSLSSTPDRGTELRLDIGESIVDP